MSTEHGHGHGHRTLDRTDPERKVAAFRSTRRGSDRIPYPIRVRTVTLAAREQITPHMLRITLTGEGVDGFHGYNPEDHVKIIFPWPDGHRTDPVNNDETLELDWPRPVPPNRCYTIRRVDLAARELDIDLVVHDTGLASDWVQNAEIGEDVVIAGPPGARVWGDTYPHYVYAVDMTAVPAVARWLDEADWLEDSPATAQIVIDYDHEEETAYPLRSRPGVEVIWQSREGGSRLAETVMSLPLPDLPVADVFLFAAGEAGDVKPLRRWAKTQGHDALIQGYWRRGEVAPEDL